MDELSRKHKTGTSIFNVHDSIYLAVLEHETKTQSESKMLGVSFLTGLGFT